MSLDDARKKEREYLTVFIGIREASNPNSPGPDAFGNTLYVAPADTVRVTYTVAGPV